jgi:hypothetical protein
LLPSSLKGWVGGLPFVKLWVDLERDGCPLRYELYRGDDLEVRTEVMRLERLTLPDGRHLWLPVTGKTMTFLGQEGPGRIVHTKEPVSVEDYGVLVETVKFDQGLSDGFFSAKKHALVANDEGLRKLQRQLEKTPKRPRRIAPPSILRGDIPSWESQLAEPFPARWVDWSALTRSSEAARLQPPLYPPPLGRDSSPRLRQRPHHSAA